MSAPLLIVGASVRAAAFSALRAGFDPVAVDLFADEDLARACPARRVEPSRYPAGLVPIAGGAPPGPWLYTGGLENHPGLLDRIAADRPLWGNGGAVVRRARDPIALAEVLRGAGLPALDARLDASGLPRDGSWLAKPLRSAGGARVRPLGEGVEPESGSYFQRRRDGPSGSAVFVAGQGGAALLVGVTRQWVGHDDAPFGYLGSVGPVRIPGSAMASLQRTGEVIAEVFGVRGLFGVDFVLGGGVAWPVEVNPRYTASVEVLEWATGRALLRDHAACFGGDTDTVGPVACGSPGRVRVGKAVVFAPSDGVVPPRHRWGSALAPRAGVMPRQADLPAPGTRFRAGQPVLTLLERAPTAEACRVRLARRHARWRARLRAWAAEQDDPRTKGAPPGVQ